MTTNDANSSPVQIKLLMNADINFDRNPGTAAELAEASARCFRIDPNRIRLYQLQSLDPTMSIVDGEFACQIDNSAYLSINEIETMLTERKHLEHNLNRAMETLVTASHLHSAKQQEFERSLVEVEQRHRRESETLENKVKQLQIQLDAARKKLEQYQKWRVASRTQIDNLRQEFVRFKLDLDTIKTE